MGQHSDLGDHYFPAARRPFIGVEQAGNPQRRLFHHFAQVNLLPADTLDQAPIHPQLQKGDTTKRTQRMDRTMDGHVLVQMLLTHHFLIRQIASFHFASQKLHSNSHPFPHVAAAGGIALSLQAENKKSPGLYSHTVRDGITTA